jgi:hypothetical protein
MVEGIDRLTEQGRSAITARHDAGGTERDAESARGAEGPGQLELLRCEAISRFVIV